MSRVDEAMRRAAVRAREPWPAAAGNPGTVEERDANELAQEPFPVEAPERTEHGTTTKGHLADTNGHPAETRVQAAERALVTNVNPSQGRSTNESESASGGDRPFDRFDPALAEKLVVDPRTPPGSREQYRRLAGILHDAQAVSGLKVLMIASAVAGEGKTLTAANLALTLSGSYRKRVLLIDADLRRPGMHRVFQIDTSYGLADGLDPTSEARLVVRQISPTLALLPAGRPTPDPMAGLISDRMRRLIEEAKETFE